MRTQDIDDILRNRTEKRQLGFSKGNTFSTATFTIEEEPQVSLQTVQRSFVSCCLLLCTPGHCTAARSFNDMYCCCCCCSCCNRLLPYSPVAQSGLTYKHQGCQSPCTGTCLAALTAPSDAGVSGTD